MNNFRELAADCRWVVSSSPLVVFDEAAVSAVQIPPELRELPPWDDEAFAGVPDEQALAWLVAYNAVNYSYWPDAGPRWHVELDGTPVGQDDEALAIMAVFAREPVHDVAWLSSMDAARLGAILAPAPGGGALPMLEVRAAALRELGAALRAHGPVARWVEEARGSASAFALRLAELLPSWDDRRTFRGRPIRFLKRAQLCTAMIHGKLRGEPFRDVEQLTAFADYRLPQILQGLGLLRLAPSLSASIEAGAQLPVDSEPEVALRAAAIDGAERLAASTGLSTLVIDHFLWRTAVARQDALPAHHRTRCTDY
jgi:hypothetical protein